MRALTEPFICTALLNYAAYQQEEDEEGCASATIHASKGDSIIFPQCRFLEVRLEGMDTVRSADAGSSPFFFKKSPTPAIFAAPIPTPDASTHLLMSATMPAGSATSNGPRLERSLKSSSVRRRLAA